MRRQWHIPVETSEGLDINMAPLIDMVFLLLIFFIVSSRLADETGLQVQRPQAATSVSLPSQSLVLAVTADGQVTHGGETFSVTRVRGVVGRLLAAGPCPVILIADRDCPTGALVRVIDECRLGGARDVNVAATREPRVP